MMRFMMVSCAMMILVSGCSLDCVRQGLYDGLRVRNDLQSSPSERVGRPESLDYGKYEQMRKEQRP